MERKDDKGNPVPHYNIVTLIVWRLVDLSSGVELKVIKKKSKGAEKLAASLAKGKKQRVGDDSD